MHKYKENIAMIIIDCPEGGPRSNWWRGLAVTLEHKLVRQYNTLPIPHCHTEKNAVNESLRLLV